MIGKLHKKLNNERGAVTIVEATFIFPIMFIVLIFLIYMGNAFYIKTQIDGIVVDKALKGASYCADPMLATIEETGSIPNIKDLDVKPYRYLCIFGDSESVKTIEDKITKEVKSEIQSTYTSFFKNMKPEIGTCKALYNRGLLTSTFSVDVECRIGFPIKMLGTDETFAVNMNIRSEVAVNDTAEFIRNVDMVIDYFCDTSFGQSIKGVFEKINEFMQNFSKK